VESKRVMGRDDEFLLQSL